MQLTPERVARERVWIRERASVIVPLINDVRMRLGAMFGVEVDQVSCTEFKSAVDVTFADGYTGVNVAGLVGLLRELEIEPDHPGVMVDELLGRELAGLIAGEQPLRLIAESTFHYADMISTKGSEPEGAGMDDLDAALAAGYQTVLPGWQWREATNPFEQDLDDESV